jgi:hypothetical protein
MTSLSQCSDCAHVVNGKLPGAGMYCEAFPQGIPTSIVLNEVSHKKPYPGDHGIQWEKGDGITPEEFRRRQQSHSG